MSAYTCTPSMFALLFACTYVASHVCERVCEMPAATAALLDPRCVTQVYLFIVSLDRQREGTAATTGGGAAMRNHVIQQTDLSASARWCRLHCCRCVMFSVAAAALFGSSA